ncbi:D-glycerate dehydrogenase [Candidatus Bathyarchaeota archaeon]|nr:D-glycerate dehydrogenase [Candidatus Bathyarchaeota archaeon]
MAKPKVYVTRQLFPEAITIIDKVADVEVFEGENNPVPRDLLLKKVRVIDGIISLLTDKIDTELMDVAENLKVVSNYAVGYNNIDVDEATRRGIMVTNTPGVLTDTTADCAFALMMSIARRIVEADKYIRNGEWVHAWGPKMFIGGDVYGKTLGIVGMGRIGSAMVPRARGFNMGVAYYDCIRHPDKEKELKIECKTLDEVLEESDFISMHVPLTPETHHMIGEEQLRKMKPTAYLVNTSRGPVIDEKALYKALKEGWIAGAALDVHEKEPMDPKSPLLELDNIIVTPHTASASVETRTKMAVIAATNCAAALKGEKPPNLVNPDVLSG